MKNVPFKRNRAAPIRQPSRALMRMANTRPSVELSTKPCRPVHTLPTTNAPMPIKEMPAKFSMPVMPSMITNPSATIAYIKEIFSMRIE